MPCYGVYGKWGGRKICIPIYALVVDWHHIGPPPPPEERVFDDIRILATINQGIAHLSDARVRENLAQSVKGAFKQLRLPEEMELGDGLLKSPTTTARAPEMTDAVA